MRLLINILLSVIIVLAAAFIPLMLFALFTDFKYQWLNKVLDAALAFCLPVLLVILAVELFAGVGLVLYAIWCM